MLSALLAVASDRRAARRLVEGLTPGGQPRGLPPGLQRAANRITDALEHNVGLDLALVAAIDDIAETRRQHSGRGVVFADLVLVVTTVAPLTVALLVTAGHVATTTPLTGPHDYAWRLKALPEAFATIRVAALSSAALFATLAALLSARWWALRSEVRDARMVRALLEAGIAAKAGLAAPRVADLGSRIAPDLSIRRATQATLLFAISVGAAGWMLLTSTPLHINNDRGLSFHRWPPPRVLGAAGVPTFAPKYPAGGPLPRASHPSLFIDQKGIHLAQKRIVALDKGRLRAGALKGAPLKAALVAFRSPDHVLELFVMCHKAVPAATVLKVVRNARAADVDQVHLVVDRYVRGPDGGPPEPTQAALTLRVRDKNRPKPAISVNISATEVRTEGTAGNHSAALSNDTWHTDVRERVRNVTRIGKAATDGAVLRVGVNVSGAISYEALIATLSAVDSACPGAEDCGLPGQGLEFVLEP